MSLHLRIFMGISSHDIYYFVSIYFLCSYFYFPILFILVTLRRPKKSFLEIKVFIISCFFFKNSTFSLSPTSFFLSKFIPVLTFLFSILPFPRIQRILFSCNLLPIYQTWNKKRLNMHRSLLRYGTQGWIVSNCGYFFLVMETFSWNKTGSNRWTDSSNGL